VTPRIKSRAIEFLGAGANEALTFADSITPHFDRLTSGIALPPFIIVCPALNCLWRRRRLATPAS